MKKNVNLSIPITLPKTQVWVNQRRPYKSICTKPDGRKVRNNLKHISTGDNFLNRRPIAHTPRLTINKRDLIKLKSFCTVNRDKAKQQPTEWEKIFTNPTSDRGLISKTYKELKKLDINKPNNPIKRWGTDLNREFSAEESQVIRNT